MGNSEMEKALRGLAGRSRPANGVNVRPGCAFGAVVEERIRGLERGMAEIKFRLNGLIFLIVGAVLVEIVMRLVR